MRSNPKAFFAVIGVLLLSACHSGDPLTVNGDFSGTYTLISINGSQLPITATVNATTTITFTAGSFTINPAGDFTETILYETTSTTTGVTTPTTSTCLGTYSQSGSSFTFTEPTSANPDCGGTYGGNANTTILSINFSQGVRAVYTK